MKKIILLFLLMLSGVTFAQEDKMIGIQKTTVSLLGYRQAVPCFIYQKNIIIDNTAGNNTVYFCVKQNGIVDTVNSIPVAAGIEKTFYNFTSDTIYVKGTSGQSVDIYILKGSGRGVQKSPGSSTNGVQYGDSLTKYSTPAQVTTALASYYTKSELDTAQLAQLNQPNTFLYNAIFKSHIAIDSSGNNPVPWVMVGTKTGDTLVLVFNAVNVFYNKVRSGIDQAGDTSSYGVYMSKIGNPYVLVRNNTGATVYSMDTTGAIAHAGSITGGSYASYGNFFPSGTGSVTWNGKSSISSSSNGIVDFFANNGTTRARLYAGTMTMTLLPTYADNAAALSGGLTAGQFYRTGTGTVMITY